MKKLLHIGITLGALIVAAAMWLIAGSQFLKLKAGPVSLKPEETFADAEGEYISYEAAYPIASWVEEYYSGDPDRKKSMGYAVYDAERHAFICIVISVDDDGRLENLMRDLEAGAEWRADRNMKPFEADGSLEPAGEAMRERASDALAEISLLRHWNNSGEESTWFEDEYGKVLGTMCRELTTDWEQTEWYVLKEGSINGLGKGEIWLCTLTLALNLLIFIFSLIGLFKGGRTGAEETSGAAGSIPDRFDAALRVPVKEWCEYNLKRGYRLAALSVIITLAIFVGIGILVNAPDRIVAFYIPLGLFFGEIVALMFWWGQKSQSKPGKIMKRLAKNLAKELPDNSLRNEFMEEYVNTAQEWDFREKTKEGMQWGKVGERFWSCFLWNGRVTVVDVARLTEVETETISGTVRSGKVRVSYTSYAARFFYQSDSPKRRCDGAISFNVKDNIGFFMTLVRKRVGDGVRITAK